MNFFRKQRDDLSRKAGRIVSQHKIAVALGVTPSLVGMWERGVLVPSLRMAAELAKVYQVSQERIEQEIVKLSRERPSKRQTASAVN